MSSSAQVRAFFQRFVLALLLVTVFTASGIGMAYWIAADKIDSAKTARFDPGTLADTQRGEPANFLIIGSDSRAFVKDATDESHFGNPDQQTGQRSDTIMIAHIDPDSHTGLLVSFPRDLWVQVPGLGGSKLNAAFNGGPQRVVETIKQNFDIPINHYLEIDFAGFQKIVDAIGTVPIYFPTPAKDKETGLQIDTAGCHRLNGEQALAYARSREYQYVGSNGKWTKDGTADLGRIRRQQYFIRSLANEAVKSGFRNFTKVNSIIDKTVSNITRDPDLGLSDILALAKTFKEVDPGVVQMITVPTERKFINGQDSQVLVKDQAAPIFASLRVFGKQAAADALPEGVVPADIHAQVLNGSGKGGLAGLVFDALQGRGFRGGGPARQRRPQRLLGHRGPLREGFRGPRRKYALAYLGGAGKLVKVDTVPAGTNVVIVLGRDFDQVKAPPTTVPDASTTTPTSVAGPAANPGGDQTLPAAGC